MLEIFVASVSVMAVSLVGVVFVWKQIGRVIERNLGFLVSSSAGVFLVLSFELAREAISESTTFVSGLLWIFAGALLVWALFKFIPSFHHHHDEHGEEHTHTSIDARRILFGDAIHNVTDGILIAASFSVGTELGILATVSVFIHELVQETSEFFVLKQAGFSTVHALRTNFLVSTTIFLGALVGFFVIEQAPSFEVFLLGLSAGAFFIVVLHDLIPHSVRASHGSGHYFTHFISFMLGISLMVGINTFFSHSHDEGDDVFLNKKETDRTQEQERLQRRLEERQPSLGRERH